jgi:hypothetical protein
MHTHRRSKKAPFIALSFVALVVFLATVAAVAAVAGCGDSSKDSDRVLLPKGRFSVDGGSTGGALEKTMPEPAAAPGGDASVPSEQGYGPSVLDPARYLVRTGDMALVVEKGAVPETAARIAGLAAGFNGYVTNSQITVPRDGQRPYAMVTVKVPSRSYDQAIARFSELGAVDSLSTATDDVTAKFVDVKARLRHYRAVEARLIGFLAKATTIGEALTVQQKIDSTQLQVEELSAQLKAMRNQVVYGTLSVAVTEPPKEKVVAGGHENSFVGALGDSGRLIVKGFEVIIIVCGALLPFAILLLVLATLVWGVVRFTSHLRKRAASTV